MIDAENWRRWRLILGKYALSDGEGGPPREAIKVRQLGASDEARDKALDYLYRREYNCRDKLQGGDAPTQMTAVTWLTAVRKLFPKSTVEFLQKQAVERYRLTQLLTDRKVLRQSTPNMALVQTLMTFRHQVPADVMVEVRLIIEQVCGELEAALAQKVLARFTSRRLRHKHGGHKQLTNLDWSMSICRNLKNYNAEYDQLILERLYFYQRQNKQVQKELFIVVDQSASMSASIIHAAVLASVFCRVRSLRAHLILFDTEVVDLTEQAGDPVENLLAVQLGGGTDIGYAMNYVASKISHPRRSMLVLISDFYEGADPSPLFEEVNSLNQSGVAMIGLAALDTDSEPCYDEYIARHLVEFGMPVSAMTPDKLAEWVAKCCELSI